MVEDGGAVAGKVLDVLEPVACFGEQPGEASLSHEERLLPVILAIELDDVEGQQSSLVIAAAVP